MTIVFFSLETPFEGWAWILMAPAYIAWIAFDVHAFRCLWQYAESTDASSKSFVQQPGMMQPGYQQPMI
jgi:hypothetical protein